MKLHRRSIAAFQRIDRLNPCAPSDPTAGWHPMRRRQIRDFQRALQHSLVRRVGGFELQRDRGRSRKGVVEICLDGELQGESFPVENSLPKKAART